MVTRTVWPGSAFAASRTSRVKPRPTMPSILQTLPRYSTPLNVARTGMRPPPPRASRVASSIAIYAPPRFAVRTFAVKRKAGIQKYCAEGRASPAANTRQTLSASRTPPFTSPPNGRFGGSPLRMETLLRRYSLGLSLLAFAAPAAAPAASSAATLGRDLVADVPHVAVRDLGPAPSSTQI